MQGTRAHHTAGQRGARRWAQKGAGAPSAAPSAQLGAAKARHKGAGTVAPTLPNAERRGGAPEAREGQGYQPPATTLRSQLTTSRPDGGGPRKPRGGL